MLEERVDSRAIRGVVNEITSPKPSKRSDRVFQEVIEMQSLHRASLDDAHVAIVDGNFNWRDKHVLQDITTSFPRQPNGSLTMVVGPVGSGKSSLLKAILGETASSNGVVSLNSPDVAFCDQTPWIMNATIRANIVAESREFDSTWFNTVINACDLALDFSRLPEGDLTVVGDKGVKLSGGQRQRLVSAPFSRK